MKGSAMRQVLLYPDPEDGGWGALVPSLPGCISEGDTRDEALRNIREAITLIEEVMREDGQAVPEDSLAAELVQL
jgi:predicted RNase H-like HicB family nuclease